MSAPYSEFVHSFFHSFISSFFPFCQPAFLPFLVIDHLSPQLHPFLLFFNSIFSLSFQSKLTNSQREGSRAQHHPFFLHPIHLYFLFFLPTLHHSVTPSFLLLSILLFFLHCSHPIYSFICCILPIPNFHHLQSAFFHSLSFVFPPSHFLNSPLYSFLSSSCFLY